MGVPTREREVSQDLKKQKIVVVEDESDILEVLRYNLERENWRVLSSRDGVQGLDLVKRELPDLLLLDLMLPSMDGLEICRRLKRDPLTESLPIIILSAKGEESDVVLGLEMGADDYVTKPFSPKELLARMRAVLRRGSAKDDDSKLTRIEYPGLVIDIERHEVRVDDRPVSFTATEMRLLHFLASHPGRVFTRDQLISRAIGAHAVVLERNIDVHVRALRKKIGPHRDRIETVRGVGYRFCQP